MCSSVDEMDQFYDALDLIVQSVPSMEALFIMGNFNATVVAGCEAWPSAIGHHGIGKMNENGQRLFMLRSRSNKHILQTQGPAQSSLVPPEIQTLAPTGHDPDQEE